MVAYWALNPKIFVRLKFPQPTKGGMTKKLDYKRIFKVLSSFTAIFVVLVASFTIPAQAVSNVIRVWNYIDKQYDQDGQLYYSFAFNDIEPYYTLARNDGAYAEGYHPLTIAGDPSTKWIQVHAWPLGVRNWPGAACNGGVIAVADFERFFTVDLSATVSMNIYYEGTGAPTNTYSFSLYSYWVVNFYDANGVNLGEQYSEGYTSNVSFTGPAPHQILQPLGSTMSIELPEGAAYFCPMLKTQLNFPEGPSNGSFVYEVGSLAEDFILTCSTNAILQNTETLSRIEDELSDLNDKTDTIINGTPEISDKVENMEDDVTNQKDDMWVVEDAEKEYLDQWEESNNEFKNSILTFLQGIGWVQLADLLSPFMNWSNWTTIMIMVVAFVNLSVILFGR